MAGGRLSRGDRERLLPRLVELAQFVIGGHGAEDERLARDLAFETLGLVNSAWRGYRRWKPLLPRVAQAQLFQLTIEHETRDGDDDCLRYYLKFLVDFCLLRSSFDACVAIGEFVYGLGGRETIDFFIALTEDRGATKDDGFASTKKRLLYEAICQRFGDRVSPDHGIGPKYRFLPNSHVSPRVVADYLARLAPWSAEGEECSRPSAAEEAAIRRAFLLAEHGSIFNRLGRPPAYRIPRFRPPGLTPGAPTDDGRETR